MILLIDNYDSFVHNLARYFTLQGGNCRVVRNDALTTDDVEFMKPEAIVISPGPCAPQQAGISIDLIKKFGSHIPILGVCLGHQAIGEAYGGLTVRAKTPMHGKASMIRHKGGALFHGLPDPLQAGRYHSLVIAMNENLDLQITATSDDEIMAVQHKTDPVYGVQFHPESVLTPQGHKMIENFLQITRAWNTQNRAAA